MRLVRVLSNVSSKYTRSKVRKALPKEYAYIIEELMHESKGEEANKHNYIMAIVETIVSTGRADHFIIAICKLIQRLTIDSLHIIGDIYDRGPGAHIIMDTLCEYHDFDIQWGNHDLVWMGAAAGSPACVANVLRMCFRYANLVTLEEGYGINLLPLATYVMEAYKDDPCTIFYPKNSDEGLVDPKQLNLCAKMHKAITVMQFKLEYQIIKRRKEFGMDDRNLLHKIDFEKGTVRIGDKDYELRDKLYPTIDPKDPYKLTPEEADIIEQLTKSFTSSARLARHMDCMYTHGALYLARNNNLMYHGSVPLNEDGTFKSLTINGKAYAGKELFDRVDQLVRNAYYNEQNSASKLYGQDFIWYLWCGPVSPPFDKNRMATFERYLLTDKEVQKEEKGHYFLLKNRKDICDMILREFGIEDTEHAHIINGHIPVKTIKGENPIKAEGKLLVIDGGYSKAYQKETGIGGYTLVYNSFGLKLVQHEPFESRQKAIEQGIDIISETKVVEHLDKRILVRDTDNGKKLQEQIEDLKELLVAYRKGVIR